MRLTAVPHKAAQLHRLRGGRMIIVETFDGARPARSPSPTSIKIDTS